MSHITNDTLSKSTSDDDAVADLVAVISKVRRDFRVFVFIVAGFAAVGVLYSLLAREWYRAEAVVVSVDARTLPGALSQFSGLASLAGVNLPSGGSLEPLAVLKSSSLTAQFIEKNSLLPLLFPDDWDSGRKEWRVAANEAPDLRDAVELFDTKILTVNDDKKSGTVTIQVSWSDPALAAAWANGLISLANDRMRRQALDEAERNVAYIQKEIVATTVPSLQQSLGRVLEGEMQKLMLARGNTQFSFKVVDRAIPPKRPFHPKRILILLGSIVIGVIFGVFVILFRARARS
jgi:uncharacterized protein involved in exopolysaccharide biosynthesis